MILLESERGIPFVLVLEPATRLAAPCAPGSGKLND